MAALQISRFWRHFFLLAIIPLAVGEVRGRGRRSDDGDPLEVVVSTLSQKVEQLTSQLTAQDTYCKEQIASLQSRVAATEQTVAFSARFSGADEHGYGVGQTLKFDTVVYNAGSGYNPVSGVFTAPANGTYVFFVHLVHSQFAGGDEEGPVEVDMMLNSSQRLLRVGACCVNMNSGSNLVTAHLSQGHTLHVQIVKGSMFLGVLHSSFSGYRLSPF